MFINDILLMYLMIRYIVCKLYADDVMLYRPTVTKSVADKVIIVPFNCLDLLYGPRLGS